MIQGIYNYGRGNKVCCLAHLKPPCVYEGEHIRGKCTRIAKLLGEEYAEMSGGKVLFKIFKLT